LNLISTLLSEILFLSAATAVAHAAVPQALVSPAPRSQTLTRIFSLSIIWANVTLILEQDRGPVYQTAPANDDNYGLGAVTLFYDTETSTQFISTGGATLQGNIDEGGQEINSDDGIDQVRREVSAVQAALTVTDGTFTMSSSTPITTLATVTAENNIPLITKYHRVKYLIKAL